MPDLSATLGGRALQVLASVRAGKVVAQVSLRCRAAIRRFLQVESVAFGCY
jgi:hypothetical protein